MRTGAFGAVLAGTLALSGCADMGAGFSGVATAVLDANETLSLETDPTGASCRLLRGSEDLGKLETPGRIELTPSREDILVLCEKPGYRTAAAVLHAEAPQTSASGAGWPTDKRQQPRYRYPPTQLLKLTAGP